MKKILGIIGIFVATVIFLSIEIGNKPIFTHLYKVISPATKGAQHATENFFNRSVTNTESFSKKIFDNSIPKVKDSVKSKMSSVRKKNAEPLEDITEREKEQLDDLIKSHK